MQYIIYAVFLVLTAATSTRPALPVTPERQFEIAQDVAGVVREETALPFDGEEGPEATSVLLAVMARYESDLREDVEDCRVRGPNGEVGLWQLAPGKNLEGHKIAEVCGSRKLQAKLALDLFVRSRRDAHDVAGLIRAYTSGSAGVSSPQARGRTRMFAWLSHTAGLEVRTLDATWAKPAEEKAVLARE